MKLFSILYLIFFYILLLFSRFFVLCAVFPIAVHHLPLKSVVRRHNATKSVDVFMDGLTPD